MNQIPYRKPQLGRDYWIKDRVLPNAAEVAERCLSSQDWVLGHPYAAQPWPRQALAQRARLPRSSPRSSSGSGTRPASATSTRKPRRRRGSSITTPRSSSARRNRARCHTPTRSDRRFADGSFPCPREASRTSGTSFYRLRTMPGTLGGNQCPPQHANLLEALGVPSLPMSAWKADVVHGQRLNRLVVLSRGSGPTPLVYFESSTRFQAADARASAHRRRAAGVPARAASSLAASSSVRRARRSGTACTSPRRPSAARTSTRSSAAPVTVTSWTATAPAGAWSHCPGWTFADNWESASLNDLFAKIARTMPRGAPGDAAAAPRRWI